MHETESTPESTPVTPPGAPAAAPPGDAGTGWTDRIVHAAGISWRLSEAGRGPVILLLHGTGGSNHSWDGLLPFLVPYGRVVAVDLPGHGGTAYPGFDRVTLPEMTRMVRAMLEGEHLVPALVVGHSSGAAVMLQLAADGALAPTATLVGINAALQALHPSVRGVMQGPVGDLFRSRAARAVVRRAGTFAPVIELLLASTGSRLTKEQEAAYVRTFTDPEHAEAAYAMMANWDLAPLVAALPRITHRTLFIVGDRDAWVPPRVAHDAADRLPHAQVITIGGAGHLVHEERPGDVASQILTAFRESTSAS